MMLPGKTPCEFQILVLEQLFGSVHGLVNVMHRRYHASCVNNPVSEIAGYFQHAASCGLHRAAMYFRGIINENASRSTDKRREQKMAVRTRRGAVDKLASAGEKGADISQLFGQAA